MSQLLLTIHLKSAKVRHLLAPRKIQATFLQHNFCLLLSNFLKFQVHRQLLFQTFKFCHFRDEQFDDTRAASTFLKLRSNIKHIDSTIII